MDSFDRREAARQFAEKWENHGNEKQDTQKFWLDLLKVFGVEDSNYIQFEKPVKMETGTGFIDAYIPETKVLIEQKSLGIELDVLQKQSSGDMLTPFQQAMRYGYNLRLSEKPRFVVVSNFEKFLIYDNDSEDKTVYEVYLKDFEKEYYRLDFLVSEHQAHLQREKVMSVKAGALVGKLYDALLDRYDWEGEKTLKELNRLCVRLVFCFYADKSGVFGRRDMFREYLEEVPYNQMRSALKNLFNVLDTPVDERDKYLKYDNPRLIEFPYVNGGLFGGCKATEIPPFTEEIRSMILDEILSFDWSGISPTIFGAAFESTLNPETRREGGMHYTSVENIHKLIGPLFLNDLKDRLEEIKSMEVMSERVREAQNFIYDIAELEFFDPACGSGNFLTETYIQLRRLENECLGILKMQG